MWKYEIPYTPKNIYPNSLLTIGTKGNSWQQIDLINKVSPGQLAKHSMVFDGLETIYLFGGVSVKKVTSSSGNSSTPIISYEYDYSNKMYMFNIVNEEWTEINYKGIGTISRYVNTFIKNFQVKFWDGSIELINFKDDQIEPNDNITYISYNDAINNNQTINSPCTNK